MQLVTSILLLRDNQPDLLQTALIGNILSSMHLMLGVSFLWSGKKRVEQHFNSTVAQVSSNLLLLTIVAIMLPMMGRRLADIKDEHVTMLSRGISSILISVYCVFLYF